MNASSSLPLDFLLFEDINSICLSHSKLGFLLVSVKSISNDMDFKLNLVKRIHESLRGSERDFCLLLYIQHLEQSLDCIKYSVSTC